MELAEPADRHALQVVDLPGFLLLHLESHAALPHLVLAGALLQRHPAALKLLAEETCFVRKANLCEILYDLMKLMKGLAFSL